MDTIILLFYLFWNDFQSKKLKTFDKYIRIVYIHIFIFYVNT